MDKSSLDWSSSILNTKDAKETTIAKTSLTPLVFKTKGLKTPAFPSVLSNVSSFNIFSLWTHPIIHWNDSLNPSSISPPTVWGRLRCPQLGHSRKVSSPPWCLRLVVEPFWFVMIMKFHEISRFNHQHQWLIVFIEKHVIKHRANEHPMNIKKMIFALCDCLWRNLALSQPGQATHHNKALVFPQQTTSGETWPCEGSINPTRISLSLRDSCFDHGINQIESNRNLRITKYLAGMKSEIFEQFA